LAGLVERKTFAGIAVSGQPRGFMIKVSEDLVSQDDSKCAETVIMAAE